MKKLTTLIIALLIAALAAGCAKVNSPEPETQTQPQTTQTESESVSETEGEAPSAADFTVLDEEENEIKLSSLYGKPTVIHFWSTKQKSVKTELEFFNELYPEYEGEVNFMLIHLTDRDKENLFRAKAFMLDNGYTFPVYFDLNGEAKKAYGVEKKPVTVFIDEKGNVFKEFKTEITKPVLKGCIEQMLDN